MRTRTSMALGILASLVALASPTPSQAATFNPAQGQEEAPLVLDKSDAGVIRFSGSGISERIVRGRQDVVLSIPVEIDNRSRKDLLVNTLDIWIVTPDGTVLSQPELRQNGVAVWRAEVNAKKRSQLVAVFRLGRAPAFDSFELHWGGLLAYKPRTGVVNYAAAPGEGYVPPSLAAEPPPATERSGSGADSDLAHDDAYGTDVYWTTDDGYYDNDPYYGLSFSFGVGYPWYPYGYYPYYGWGSYPYYPYYPGYGCYDCYGYRGRQVKEDAILRKAGIDPATGKSGVQRVDTITARSRDRGTGEPGRVVTTTGRSSRSRATSARSSGSRSTVGRTSGSRTGRGSTARPSSGRSSAGRSGAARSGGGRSSSGGSRSAGRGRKR